MRHDKETIQRRAFERLRKEIGIAEWRYCEDQPNEIDTIKMEYRGGDRKGFYKLAKAKSTKCIWSEDRGWTFFVQVNNLKELDY